MPSLSLLPFRLPILTISEGYGRVWAPSTIYPKAPSRRPDLGGCYHVS